MKKNCKLLSMLLALLLAMSLTACQKTVQAPVGQAEMPSEQPTFTAEPAQRAESPAEKEPLSFTPGTYRGEAMGHNAVIAVDVTFSENEITAIEVAAHSESKGIGDVAMEETKS